MSVRRNSLGTRSTSVGRQQQSRTYGDDSNIDLATKTDVLPNIFPEVCITLKQKTK